MKSPATPATSQGSYPHSTNYRFEFKYILEPRIAGEIESFIKGIGFALDPKAEKEKSGSYIVSSLYFDSPYFSDYYEKIDGLLERKKVRARIYNNLEDKAGLIWFEIKYKHDMYITKKRLRLSPTEWDIFNQFLLETGKFYIPTIKHDTSPQKELVLKDLKQHVIYGAMRPHILVRYRRVPYVGYFESPIRITFDTEIEACRSRNLDTPTNMISVEKDKTILEVKFNESLPQWFGNLVKQFGIKREKYSKYTTSVDAVYGKDFFSY